MTRTPFASADRKAIKARDGNRCRKCRGRQDLEIHHIKPVVDGGTNALENLILLCAKCHAERHLVGSVMPSIGWEKWLTLPPMAIVLHWLVSLENPEFAELTVAEARHSLLYAFEIGQPSSPRAAA